MAAWPMTVAIEEVRIEVCDLYVQELEGEYDPDDPIEFDMVKDGKTVGKVHLEFEACV